MLPLPACCCGWKGAAVAEMGLEEGHFTTPAGDPGTPPPLDWLCRDEADEGRDEEADEGAPAIAAAAAVVVVVVEVEVLEGSAAAVANDGFAADRNLTFDIANG